MNILSILDPHHNAGANRVTAQFNDIMDFLDEDEAVGCALTYVANHADTSTLSKSMYDIVKLWCTATLMMYGGNAFNCDARADTLANMLAQCIIEA